MRVEGGVQVGVLGARPPQTAELVSGTLDLAGCGFGRGGALGVEDWDM